MKEHVKDNLVDSFQNKFLNKYMTPEKQALLEREYWQRQQGVSEAAWSYYRDKLRLYERCTLDISDIKFISHVINGLTPVYADMYMDGMPSSLDTLVQGLNNADHRYYGVGSQQGVSPAMGNASMMNYNMQQQHVPMSANQVTTAPVPSDPLESVADKLLSKMYALMENKTKSAPQ